MEQPDSEPVEESAAPAATRTALLRAWGARVLHQLAGLLPKLGLFLFMAVAPLLISAYPAYLIALPLLDYAAAKTVEAKLSDIEIKAVQNEMEQGSLFESRKHFDIIFHFATERGEKYASVQKKSWPAPGLKRKLDAEYQADDLFTLYMLPDHRIEMDEVVARDGWVRLTALMGLLCAVSALFFLLWRRLAGRLLAVMPRFPAATAKSIMLGQVLALLIATPLAWMAIQLGVVLPGPLYPGAYLALAALLALSLRLLVFAEQPPPPVTEPEPELKRERIR